MAQRHPREDMDPVVSSAEHPMENGEPRFLVGSMHPECPDPECFVAGQQIEQIKRDWESAVDALPQMTCVLDDQGRLVRANRAMERWGLGSTEEAKGRDLHDVLHPDCKGDACYFGAFWDRARRGLAKNQSVEQTVLDQVLQRYLHFQVQPSFRSGALHDGSQRGVSVVVIDDLSEVRRAQESLCEFKDQLELIVAARTAELCSVNRRLTEQIKKRERAEARLRESENELKLLSAQLLSAQEMERQRIASDLHDGLGQLLSVAKFCMEDVVNHLSQGATRPAVQGLARGASKLQAAVDEVRRICANLRPSTLDDLGLLPTLAWYFRDFQSVYRELRVEKEIDIQEGELPVALRTVIFRIIQEAVNNVTKHAEADRVRVSLRRVGKSIELKVADNGRGFEPAQIHVSKGRDTGFGLAIVRERAEFSGGRFRIDSTPGKGTEICVRWADCKSR